MFTPCNAEPISLGHAPRNSYPACPTDKNGRIEEECLNFCLDRA